MRIVNNGGPAFPSDEIVNHLGIDSLNQQFQGMSLRAFIATKAMNAIISGQVSQVTNYDGTRHLTAPEPGDIAKCACQYADALIAELSK